MVRQKMCGALVRFDRQSQAKKTKNERRNRKNVAHTAPNAMHRPSAAEIK